MVKLTHRQWIIGVISATGFILLAFAAIAIGTVLGASDDGKPAPGRMSGHGKLGNAINRSTSAPNKKPYQEPAGYEQPGQGDQALDRQHSPSASVDPSTTPLPPVHSPVPSASTTATDGETPPVTEPEPTISSAPALVPTTPLSVQPEVIDLSNVDIGDTDPNGRP